MISASPALIPLLVPLHGIGGRQDLPLPFGYLLTGSAVAVAVSFLVLGLAWKTPRYRGADAGIPLPLAISQAVDPPAFRWAVRGVGLLVFFFMAAALYFGKDLLTNPIFGFIYVWVWVGLVPISLLFGPVWRTLNPLRSLHLLGCRLIQVNPDRGLLRLPGWIGIWPATLGLFAFVWLELVVPYRVTTPVVLLWADLYVVAGLLGAIFFGQRWFSAADPFEVYALLVAKLSVWGRRGGRLVARGPLENLDSLVPRPGVVLFVSVLLGSTAYDGFSNSTAWVSWLQNQTWPTVALGTLTLLAFIAVVVISFSSAVAAAGGLSGTPRAPSARQVRAHPGTDRPGLRHRPLPNPVPHRGPAHRNLGQRPARTRLEPVRHR